MSEQLPMPTRGPVGLEISGGSADVDWEIAPLDGNGACDWCREIAATTSHNRADADLIVAAFNSAEECRKMGYDPIAAVQALPKLLTYIADDECFCCPPVPICAKCAALADARTRSQPA